jgi:cysteinyl-tRNA synthetase
MLKLYNSLIGKKELFSSIKSNNVSMYVCGITPYDTTHLGHAFTYVSFDVLVRVLKSAGFKVNYTQNVTDINDRDTDILKRAKEQNISWQNLAQFWTKKFLDDMKSLNWVMPTNFLKASKNIASMIKLVEKLLANSCAYERNGSIYLDVSKIQNFGKLSKFPTEKMLKISRDFDEEIDNPDRRNTLDFTLWKAKGKNEPSHIPSFASPFGPGRPGWHIECSSMSIQTLGDQIDIHGGGIDLIYPHHEAEIAQSEGATGKTPFAKYWIHTATVAYQGKKMSKSLGNLIMISNLLKKYSSNVIRWYLISHHYRQSFEYFTADMEKANRQFLLVSEYVNKNKSSCKSDEDIFIRFKNALENDLDTPLALEIISNTVLNKGSAQTLKKCLSLLGFLI